LDRKDFLKRCAIGVCSCAAGGICGTDAVSSQSANPEADRLNGQLKAVRIRYAKLVEVLGRELDETTRNRLFHGLGRECALQFRARTFEKYKGDLEGFLADAKGPGGWMAAAEYDKKAGKITITDSSKNCTCPLVKKGITSGLQCECTLGWQEQTYGAILGRRVKATLAESILRGGDKCVFRIEIIEGAL
jgi:hypothetical protein